MTNQQPEPSRAEGSRQAPGSTSETYQRRRKAVGCLLQVFALQLTLFGLLAWFVHIHPIVPLDVAITRSFQQNQDPWLRLTMLAISYPGSSPLLPVLVILTTLVFWARGIRLEAVFVAGLSTVSLLLNLLIKVQVARPRPTGHLVQIIQTTLGYSFPSGHVTAYLAYWGYYGSLFTEKICYRIP
jgi:membrane-associated phospholipid phosphatase